MQLNDIVSFQFKRENAFEGLVIDADTWRDAHKYHRDHHRLHVLAFHGTGIVGGLEVVARNTPDLSVTIQPGMAVDPDGNTVIVSKAQRHSIQTREKGVVYLIIQFREVPSGPFQPPDGGQPTRILEAYRIQERDKLPDEPYLELARIDFDPSEAAIKNAGAAAKPGKNEIDLRHRQTAMPLEEASPTPPPPPRAAPEKPAAVAAQAVTREQVVIGHAALGGDEELHLAGLRNLATELNMRYDFEVRVEEKVSLDKDVNRLSIVYLTGKGTFELTAKQQASLGRFLEAGGTIFGEACTDDQAGTQSRGPKEFGLAFNQLASHLGSKLESVQRGHQLLQAAHVFPAVPPGVEAGIVLEGGHVLYSACDYGCAWEGGRPASPLTREAIRSAVEMGANIAAYSRRQGNA